LNLVKQISSEGEATLHIEIPVEETAGQFTDALKKFRDEVKLPGFRPGKVPLELIRKRWGREIFSEKADEIARKYVVKALEQEKLKPGSRIDLNLIEYAEDKPLKFSVTFPLAPEVKLSLYKGLKVTLNDAEISNDDIDRELEGFRRKHAIMRSIDDLAPAEAHLTVKVQEVDPSGLPLIGRKVEEKTVELGFDQLGIGSDEQLIGVRAGEKLLIRIRPAPGDISHTPLQSAIVTPNQALDRRASNDLIHLAVEVLKVEIPQLPELNDEFALSVDPNLKSIDNLREIFKFRLMSYVESVKRRQLEKSIIHHLIEENPFYVPEKIVSETLNEVADGANYEGDERRKFLDNYRKEAEDDYRWVRLRDEIASQENISINNDHINGEIERYAAQHGKTVETASREFEKEGLENIRTRMLEHEVIEFLVSNAVIEKRSMSLTEFFKSTMPSD